MLYPSFSDFMTAAIKRAEPSIGANRTLPMKLTTIVYGLIEKGWGVFSSTATLLKLGIVAFIAALAAFLISGVGLIVIAVLAIAGFAAREGMKYLYDNKWFSLAILKVGNRVKGEYESSKYDDNAVSLLLERTANLLIEECK